MRQRKGILPRCLFVEDAENPHRGCVIVGINPGTASMQEMDFYLQNGPTYLSVVNYWKHKYPPYYKLLRDFIRNANLIGPILWTELVKCQSDKAEPSPSLQTFRTCVSRFLNDELKLVPPDWPLIAVGRESYKALAYIYPKRIVIGVPHPTSSRGQFAALVQERKSKAKNNFKLDELWQHDEGLVKWLSA